MLGLRMVSSEKGPGLRALNGLNRRSASSTTFDEAAASVGALCLGAPELDDQDATVVLAVFFVNGFQDNLFCRRGWGQIPV